MDSSVALRWRRATLVASGIAVLELLVLVAGGVYLLGRGVSRHVRADAVRAARPAAPVRTPTPPRRVATASARLPRSETSVLVLNGNGTAGAATAGAARLAGLGYVVSGVGDAPEQVERTTIMYSPGFRGEAVRLARDLHGGVVSPLDGLRPSQLLGAHLALLLGRD